MKDFKELLFFVSFTALVIAMPYITDRMVDYTFPYGDGVFTAAEREAHDDLVVRAGLEAEAHHKQVATFRSESERAVAFAHMFRE